MPSVIASVPLQSTALQYQGFLNLQDTSSPLTEISNAVQMQNALESTKAVIFAHVDWAVHSLIARRTVTEFAVQWRQNGSDPFIDFYFLDLTNDQKNAPAYVSEWLDSDNRLSGLPIRGSGDVVWLKDGSFQKWRPAYDATVNDLNAETKAVFGD
ncbi:MAG: hypothetical protein AAF483_17635 [Planctomycetota bacterium]